MRLLRKRRDRSPAMSTEDANVLGYLRQNVLPRAADIYDHYVPSRRIGTQGLQLNDDEQLARLEKWRGPAYQTLYERLRNDAVINCPFNEKSYLGTTCLHNGWYPTPDAEIYASMIYDLRPEKIVEVGSGFSTLIARSAIEYSKLDASLTVIDPKPRTDVAKAADRVIHERVEDVKLDQFALTGRSLLFIDSSHITRPRGDVPYLYCEVLPRLAAGTIVHFHDIFLPFDYPTCYDHLCWTEQYVLQALLSNTTRYHTLFATQYMTRHHTANMQQTFGPEVGTDNLFFGASFWIQVR
jgi:hypothetical protein